jgi:hypothetical protein
MHLIEPEHVEPEPELPEELAPADESTNPDHAQGMP